MFKLLIFIALAFPFFAFAQQFMQQDRPMPEGMPTPMGGQPIPEIYSHDDKPVSRDSLLHSIKSQERRYKFLLREYEKKNEQLTTLQKLYEKDKVLADPLKIYYLTAEVHDLSIDKAIQTLSLENEKYALARLDDKPFFKFKNIPGLLQENEYQDKALNNLVQSFEYYLKHYFLTFTEGTEEERKEADRVIDIILDRIERFKELKNILNTQHTHLLNEQKRLSQE